MRTNETPQQYEARIFIQHRLNTMGKLHFLGRTKNGGLAFQDIWNNVVICAYVFRDGLIYSGYFEGKKWLRYSHNDLKICAKYQPLDIEEIIEQEENE